MIDQTLIDKSLARVYDAFCMTRSRSESDRITGNLMLRALIKETRQRMDSLHPFRHVWSFRATTEGVLIVTVELTEAVLPAPLTTDLDLSALKAIAWVIYTSLGIQQVELIGCDRRGVSVEMSRIAIKGEETWHWHYGVFDREVA